MKKRPTQARWGELPGNLRPRYHRSRRDRNQETLNDDIALIDTRLAALLRSLDKQHDSAVLWRTARESYGALRGAINAGNQEGVRNALVRLGEILDKGVETWRVWAEVTDVVEFRRRLIETSVRVGGSRDVRSLAESIQAVKDWLGEPAWKPNRSQRRKSDTTAPPAAAPS